MKCASSDLERNGRGALSAVLAMLVIALAAPRALAQTRPGPGETCVIQVLNTSTLVAADGAWTLPNVPSLGGLVRARLVCQGPAGVRLGQSTFFEVPPSVTTTTTTRSVDALDPGPLTIALTAETTLLTTFDAPARLTVTGRYPGGRDLAIGTPELGTSFVSTDPGVVSVDALGVYVAHAPGTVMLTAWNQGIAATVQVTARVGDDADQDGLPDEWELRVGLSPQNALDALVDSDADGLSNLEEFAAGSWPQLPDSDDDGIVDGEEVRAGDDGFLTSPILRDTDGDALPDALEIQYGSDPTDPLSANYAAIVTGLTARPERLFLQAGVLADPSPRTLAATALLVDGTGVDVTAHALTSWQIGDGLVAGFGPGAGTFIGTGPGATTITVAFAGHAVEVPVFTQAWEPRALALVPLPGLGLDVDLAIGPDAAWVACGEAGLVAVDVSRPDRASVASVVPLAGTTTRVASLGWQVAAAHQGADGAHVALLDVGDPAAPEVAHDVPIGGAVEGLALGYGLALAARGADGLVVIGYVPGAPTSPPVTTVVPGLTAVRDVAVAMYATDTPAVVLTDTTLQVVDLTDPADPRTVGQVALAGGTTLSVVGKDLDLTAYVYRPGGPAPVVVDLADPSAPTIVSDAALPGLDPTPRSHRDVVGLPQADGGASGLFASYEQGFPRLRAFIFDARGITTPGLLAAIDPDVRQAFGSFTSQDRGVAADETLLVATTARELNAAPALLVTRHTPPSPANLIAGSAGDTVPPVVGFVRPDNPTRLFQGITLPGEDAPGRVTLEVQAGDDVAVAAVRFYVDDVVEVTLSGSPWTTTLELTRTDTYHVEAEATDFAGNTSARASLWLQYVPPPTTTVTGKVVDTGGAAVSGAIATIVGTAKSAGTNATGVFTIAAVDAMAPFSVSVVAGGAPPVVVGPFDPVEGGTTDVGNIVVAPLPEPISVGPVVSRPVRVRLEPDPTTVTRTTTFLSRDVDGSNLSFVNGFVDTTGVGALGGHLFDAPVMRAVQQPALVVPVGETFVPEEPLPVYHVIDDTTYPSITVYGTLVVYFGISVETPGDLVCSGCTVHLVGGTLLVGGELRFEDAPDGTPATLLVEEGASIYGGLVSPGVHRFAHAWDGTTSPFSVTTMGFAGDVLFTDPDDDRIDLQKDAGVDAGALRLAISGDLAAGDVVVSSLMLGGSAEVGDLRLTAGTFQGGLIPDSLSARGDLTFGTILCPDTQRASELTVYAGGRITGTRVTVGKHQALKVLAGGDVTIPTIETTSGSGGAGAIQVRSEGALTASRISSGFDAADSGRSGDVTVTARRLVMPDGLIASGATTGTSQSGVVLVQVEAIDDASAGLVVRSGDTLQAASGAVTLELQHGELDDVTVASGVAPGGSGSGAVTVKSQVVLRAGGGATITSGGVRCPWTKATGAVTLQALGTVLVEGQGTTVGTGELAGGTVCIGPTGALTITSGGPIVVGAGATVGTGVGSPRGADTRQEHAQNLASLAPPPNALARGVMSGSYFRSRFLDTGSDQPRYLSASAVPLVSVPGAEIIVRYAAAGRPSPMENGEVTWVADARTLPRLRYYAFDIVIYGAGAVSPSFDDVVMTWEPGSCLTSGVACNDGFFCTDDACVPEVGCVYTMKDPLPVGCEP
ncbi:MAG: hypothetical protein IT385_27315 [Deltaproteobacteria bacterium]|nr:hypothetical protein [Deltaproteobacteria bacterium]